MYTPSCTLSMFLRNHRYYKNKNKSWTNTKMPISGNKNSGGCYRISQKEYDNFLKCYSYDIDSNCNCNNKRLTEKFQDEASIVVDLDLRFETRPKDIVFNKELIKNIVKIHTDYLSKHFNYNKIKCIVLTCKDNPVFDPRTNRYKDGIHLQFPYLILDKPYTCIMREDLMGPIHKLLEKTGNINSISNTYDSVMMGHTPWLLYGSHKPNRSSYEVNCVLKINKEGELRNITNAFKVKYNTTYSLVKLLSVGLEKPATEFKNNSIKQQLLARYSQMMCERKEKCQNKREHLFCDSNKSNPLEPNTIISGMEEYQICEIVELLECLSPERSIDYDLWIYVGLALHNISNDLFPIFDQFSKMGGDAYCGSKKCKEKWDSFNKHPGKGTLGLGSLRIWCKEDNPEKYKKLRHTFDMIIELARNTTHYATAKLLYKMYGRRIKCSINKSGKKQWFIFLDGLWCERSPDFHLRSYMSEELYCRCSEINSILRKNNEVDEDSSPIEKKLNELMNKLQTNSYKNSVIKECEIIFRKWMFQKDLDQNKYLIAFKNGIYDFKNHKFRLGVPEDFISYCCPVKYNKLAVNEKLNEFIEQILPLPELRKFVLKILSLSLTGIFLERLFICIGVGANGKSSLLNLLYRVLGEDYMTSVKPQLLTKSNGNTEGPSPSFAKTRGKRCVYAEEISRKESVDIGQFKYIMSRGLKSARFLNENEFDFYPFYTFFLLVNHTPHIDATDPATWRRILCIPFLSKFVDNPDPKEPYHFKIDRDIEDKYFDEWAPAFLNILIEHLKLYQKEGLNPPQIVKECTNNYRNKCDYINSFARMYLINTNKHSDTVTVPKVYEKFCEWYRKYKELKVPDSTEMRHLLESNYFKQEAIELEDGELGWRRFKLKDPYSFNDSIDN